MKIEGQIPSQADVDAILTLVDAVQGAQSRGCTPRRVSRRAARRARQPGVLAKDEDTWRIAAAQNTVVVVT